MQSKLRDFFSPKNIIRAICIGIFVYLVTDSAVSNEVSDHYKQTPVHHSVKYQWRF